MLSKDKKLGVFHLSNIIGHGGIESFWGGVIEFFTLFIFFNFYVFMIQYLFFSFGSDIMEIYQKHKHPKGINSVTVE